MKYLLAILSLIWLSTSLLIIDARKVAIITMFGDPVQEIQQPGLYFKAPWPIQQVHRLEGRAQLLQIEPFEAFTKDTKNLVLTPMVIWKVSNPTLFLQRIRDEEKAARPLRDIVTSYIAASIGKRNFTDVLSVNSNPAPLLSSELLQTINVEAKQPSINDLNILLNSFFHSILEIANPKGIIIKGILVIKSFFAICVLSE